MPPSTREAGTRLREKFRRADVALCLLPHHRLIAIPKLMRTALVVPWSQPMISSAVRTGTLLICAVATSIASAQIANIVVTSASTFETGMPPQGSIASVFCTGLTHATGVVAAPGSPLPYELAGVRVSVDGADAPIFAVAASSGFQQINIQVPLEAQFESSAEGSFVTIQIHSSEGSGSARVSLRDTPGDFFRFENSAGLFQRAEDYSVITDNNAARPGEYVVGYLTGLPSAQPPVPTGQVTPLEPLSIVPQTQRDTDAGWDRYTISVGGEITTPTFLGLAPGYVGVYQVNFIVPAFTPSGVVQVVLQRDRCVAFFGSCINGGGMRHQTASSPATIVIR